MGFKSEVKQAVKEVKARHNGQLKPVKPVKPVK
jgi:hypothetical protein